MALLDQLLPVGTLVLGIALQQVSTNYGSGRAARQAARDLLAEHRRFVWDKDEETSWIELQVYEGRLRSALTSARVPRVHVQRALSAMTSFWRELDFDPDGGWHATTESMTDLDAAADMLNDFLDESVRVRRRARAGKPTGDAPPPAPLPTTPAG